jgi:hypothetical protein
LENVKYQNISVSTITNNVYADTQTQVITPCLWKHLTNVEDYNRFYGTIEPYIIEYPFSYKFQDEILQM